MAKLYFSNVKLRRGDTPLLIEAQEHEFPLVAGKFSIIPSVTLAEEADAIAFFLHDNDDDITIQMEPDNVNVKFQPLLDDEHDITINPFIADNYLYIAIEKKEGCWTPGVYDLVGIDCVYEQAVEPEKKSVLKIKVVYLS